MPRPWRRCGRRRGRGRRRRHYAALLWGRKAWLEAGDATTALGGARAAVAWKLGHAESRGTLDGTTWSVARLAHENECGAFGVIFAKALAGTHASFVSSAGREHEIERF